jgi:LexA-binding, inner membrane-associated putative hydrolase
VPSPIGHGLAAVSVGWAATAPAADRRAFWAQTLTLAAIGMAPDLDLLVGRHSAETHSLGAAVLAACLAAWWRWPVAAGRWRIWLIVFLAWASHPLLDMLAPDNLAPYGVMLFWPLSDGYYISGLHVFDAISRTWQAPGSVAHDLWAVVREVAILGPVTTALYWFRRPPTPTGRV